LFEPKTGAIDVGAGALHNSCQRIEARQSRATLMLSRRLPFQKATPQCDFGANVGTLSIGSLTHQPR
jgi:hypothetical protein